MNILLTGASGMIGESALNECLASPAVSRVLIISRRPLGREHHKLTEVLHKDFTDFAPLRETITAFQPDACFHCMGVSSVGMDEEKYTRLTYNVAVSLTDEVYAANPNAAFIYVSGAGSDATEQGSTMWARVKGKTENLVLNRGFRDAYAFRIGAVIPQKGVKSSTGWVNTLYTLTKPLHNWMSGFDSIITSSQLGQAMIRLVKEPDGVKTLGNGDIGRVAKG